MRRAEKDTSQRLEFSHLLAESGLAVASIGIIRAWHMEVSGRMRILGKVKG